jgi:ribosomal protein S18 acetylase RimI-like enzyme
MIKDFKVTEAAPTTGEDFERVGGQLSAQPLQKGAAGYNPLNYTFKACSDVGAVLGEAIVTQNWGKLEIDLMHVHEENRGQGIGKALISAIEAFARANFLKAIRLNTPTWQGVGFYERAGFTEMGRISLQEDSNGNPHYEVTYYKILNPE